LPNGAAILDVLELVIHTEAVRRALTVAATLPGSLALETSAL
jgi:hypothetical protein